MAKSPGSSPSQIPGPAGGSTRPLSPRTHEIFGSFKDRPEGGSIFGDGMMSEKSLDEVILSYLAEDLESEPKKR